MLKIGNVTLETNVLLAPMAGVTDYPFRTIIRKFGKFLVFSEMIASQAMIRHVVRTKKMVDRLDDMTAIQIAGSDPDVMAEAAKISVDCGARLLDINMGCPVKKIVNNYAGSALMKDERLAGRIMESVVRAVGVPVSLKTRLGWDSDHRNAVSMAKIAENSGIKMITIHGRTRSQMFNGKAAWDQVRATKDSVSIPVIVNGDINSPDDASKAVCESGCDGVMIGRGSVGSPWLLNMVDHRLNSAALVEFDRKALLQEHIQLMLEFYTQDNVYKLCRKVLLSYCKGFGGASALRDKINRIDNLEDTMDVLQEISRGI